jgi:hypothetical protein
MGCWWHEYLLESALDCEPPSGLGVQGASTNECQPAGCRRVQAKMACHMGDHLLENGLSRPGKIGPLR